MLDASFYRKTDEIIARYVRDARSLIPIMQDIQAEYRYLPAELLSYVAKEIGITELRPILLLLSMKTSPLRQRASTSLRFVTALPAMSAIPPLFWKPCGRNWA